MKILVLSDSHGRETATYEIMAEHTDSDVVIHLGDGEDDIDLGLRELPAFGNKRFIRVRGNCDLGSGLPETSFDNLGGYKFYITHGYRQGVKSGVHLILGEALKNDRNVVLFGHTHQQFYEERHGVHLFNPGSVQRYEYGVIIINEKDGTIKFEHFN
ncbi:MAG: YfcE family phosphodiesterase [Lachnospiraceae bacterium]|nr:YfcE family phosphodiesterase [Lachnospiraceae bacterium]